MNSICTMMFLLVATMATLGSYKVQGQSYHFSNGWNPGKRSSSQDKCQFRTEVKTLVFKLIEDEVLRMVTDPTCFSGVPALSNLLKKDIGYPQMDDNRK